MKTQKGSRLNDNDELRKPRRLEPNHKSGKTRHNLSHGHYHDDEDDEELMTSYTKKRSAYDYFDDEDEPGRSIDDEEEFDEEEEYDEEEDSDEDK